MKRIRNLCSPDNIGEDFRCYPPPGFSDRRCRLRYRRWYMLRYRAKLASRCVTKTLHNMRSAISCMQKVKRLKSSSASTRRRYGAEWWKQLANRKARTKALLPPRLSTPTDSLSLSDNRKAADMFETFVDKTKSTTRNSGR